jgi:hypothetical protein
MLGVEPVLSARVTLMMEENSSDTLGGAASAATAKHKKRSTQANVVFILWLERERSVLVAVGENNEDRSVRETTNTARDFYGDLVLLAVHWLAGKASAFHPRHVCLTA